MRDHGARLFGGVVLRDGDEIIVPPGEQRADGGRVAREGVVCRDGKDDGTLVAQMGLGGESHGPVGDAAGELRERVAGAGRDDEAVEQLFWADRLRLRDGMENFMAADRFDAGAEICRCAEAGVGRVAGLGEDGDDVGLLGFQAFQHIQHAGKRTE